ncbi:MAG: PQQ-binding-like beta-propeller repeat protein [Acidobacteriota bacterium]|nr:PQQ-binding-like beta-propeller repeat protein [Acidobacteriota bacterium]
MILRSLLALTVLGLSPQTLDAADWPSFRGPFARGVADHEELPESWNPETGANVLWSREIPGTGHSSPIVVAGKVFVATAVTDGELEMVLGDTRTAMPKDTEREFSWRLYRLDAATGALDWVREAHTGSPRANRHPKSSQANATPAATQDSVVAIFASEGIVTFDFDGQERWRHDLGVLDPGLFGDPSSQWGHASSPTIHDGRVFVQVDRHSDSFIVAYDLATGAELWKVERQEKPVWATPTIHESDNRTQLIVVGGDFDRGLDAATGKELWRFERDLQVKTPTPFVADDRVVLAGGFRGMELHAISIEAEGDVEGEELLWTSGNGGPYTSTPVAYRGRVFYARDTGILNVLDLRTGERLHRRRLDTTISASPVASDGRVFFVSEVGEVHILSAEPPFEELAAIDMGEPCMSTPAIAGGTMFVRCRSRIWAIARHAGL